jgi:hypothetical protein
MTTSGFYKKDIEILYAPNLVYNVNYTLNADLKDDYTYPVDGWYWFDTIELAYSFFNEPLPDWYLEHLEEFNNG